MIEQFLQILQSSKLLGLETSQPMGDEEIADVLWLAWQMKQRSPSVSISDYSTEEVPRNRSDSLSNNIPTQHPDSYTELISEPEVPIVIEPSSTSVEKLQDLNFGLESDLSIEVEAASAIPNPSAFSRALKYLRRKVPSKSRTILDVEATVDRIARRDVWLPIIKPDLERWLDVELVIEASEFSFIWQSTFDELQHHFERQCGFRSLRTWELVGVEEGELHLLPRHDQVSASDSRNPHELIDPQGRRIIIFISDCRSLAWQQGKIHNLLRLWSEKCSLTLFQLLPERLWDSTELKLGQPIQVSAITPLTANTALRCETSPQVDRHLTHTLLLPVVTLTTASLRQWAFVLTGNGHKTMPARFFDLAWVQSVASHYLDSQTQPKKDLELSGSNVQVSPEKLLELFFATALPMTQRLAIAMAFLPVSLRIINLLQDGLLPNVQIVHVAEFYACELISKSSHKIGSDGSPLYDFVPGVRQALSELIPEDEAILVLEALSQAIAKTLGLNINSFTALLSPQQSWSKEVRETLLPFAYIATKVLYRLGGDYAELAKAVEADASFQEAISDEAFPPLQSLHFETAQLIDEIETNFPAQLQSEEFVVKTFTIRTGPSIQSFEYQTAQLTYSSGRFWPVGREGWKIQSQQKRGQFYCETLSDDLVLRMVSIPSGNFMMGSPKDEPERGSSEGPQHPVNIPAFFMGRYPITQAQWKIVASYPEINLELNPDPSQFKGDNRPVEQVNWHEAVEFCARLSAKTNRPYRLPSEAEWEYACRAGTTTPFYFGKTLTTDIANYYGDYTYNDGPKGKYRKETTPVEHFKYANALGLHDMHGNVDEWCQDTYHSNYKGAPDDGSAWMNENDNDSQKVLRGGSWFDLPGDCRSATRIYLRPDSRDSFIGFRVVCSAPSSLP